MDALRFSIPTMMMVTMMMMMMMTVPLRPDPNGNAGTVMVMVMMTDHNLSGLNGACLGQPGIVGF